MLTRILLGYMLRTAALVVGVGVVVGLLVGGPDFAWAMALGGVLVGGSGAVQIWLVGVVLDPAQSTPQKLVCGTILLFKLLIVAGVLWWILARLHPDHVGLLIGMGLGLMSLILGVNRGSTSEEGLRAMEDDEQKIAEKMEDMDEEKR